MWTNSYSTVTDLSAEQVWSALKALHMGELTYDGADEFEIDGPFAAGTHVKVTPVGQDTFDSTIVEVIENVTYADQTEFGDITLLFRHVLETTADGTKVTHSLVIDGDGADEIGPELGPQISGDFDESMHSLLEVARSL